MMNVKKVLIASCIALAVSSTAMANSLKDIEKKGVIRIGVDISAPPYGMLDKDAQQVGFDIESAKSLAEYLGVKLQVVPVTGPTRVQYLLTNRVDAIMASFSITEERKKVIDFSKPYGIVPVVVGGPSNEKLASLEDLSGKNIAVTRGTTSDQALTKGIGNVPKVTITRYDDDATTNTAVVTGQQNYIVGATSVLSEIKKSKADRDVVYKFTIVSFPMGVGLRKNEKELKEKVNQWVVEKLGNGTLNSYYEKYFEGQTLPKVIE